MQIVSNLPLSLQNTLEKWSVFFIYLFINGLFVLKYGEALSIYLVPFYITAVFSFAIFYSKINWRESIYKYFFWIVGAVFFLVSVGLNYYIDGKSLNVDRWDAMEVGIKAMFQGEYPYNIKDYLGRESSNLPFLIILGMPFYLLFGSVGFLQSFTFLLFCYLIFKIFDSYKLRLAALILLILSPGYLWEIYTKSDLLSNFILVVGFAYLIWTHLIKERKIKIEWLSVMTALILLTRLSVLIPLIIILFKAFYHFSLKEKVRFVSVFFLTAAVILFFFFRNADGWETIVAHNPFRIQGSKQPVLLNFFYISMAVIFAFKVKTFFNLLFYSGVLLFFAVLVPYLLYLVEYGYANVMDNSFFDLSFFNMSMPFIIISLVFILKGNLNNIQK